MLEFTIYDRYTCELDTIYGYTFEDALYMAHLDNSEKRYMVVKCEYMDN
jgi:hypothetical protein